MKRILILMLLISSAVTSFAQGRINVQAPNLVASDEQFNLTFIMEGESSPSNFEWNCPSEFQLVWGPQKGSSTSISIVNGKKSKSSQTTYTYVLMPKVTGNCRIPSAKAVIDGETVYSKELAIEVVGADASSSRSEAEADAGTGRSPQGIGEIANEDIFLKLNLSKTKAVVGETITATLKLYQRVNIAGFEDAKFPSFNGFWSQETQAPTNIEFKRENVGNKIYNTAVIRGYTLIPQQAGELTIDPAELICIVSVRKAPTGSGSIFDSFFQDDYQTVRKRVSTKPVTVRVSSLPSGAPSSFGGGVGSFKMDVRLTRDSVTAHDAASLIVNVSGKGNVALLEAPKINFPPDFEVYDVKSVDESSGRKFEFPFIPRSHGSFEIGPVEYAYFDVTSGKYITLRSEALKLEVARGNDDVPSGVSSVPSGSLKKDVRSLGDDIRFIKTECSPLQEKGSLFAMSPWFFIIPLALLVCAAVLFFAFRDIRKKRADVVWTRKRSATKMARKRLAKASEYLQKNLYSAFYEELHKALLGFISDKLNMDVADLSKENISGRLVESGVPDNLAAEFVSLVDACEYARYSPDQGNEAMSVHYEKAISIISSIDSNMKHGNSGKAKAVSVFAALILMIPFSSGAVPAEHTDSLWNAGVQAYLQGDWAVALDAWTSINDLGLESSDLYLDIGNAFFKNQEYAKAVLFYERAAKLNPSNADVRYNLEFVANYIQDKIEPVPEFFLKSWARKFRDSLPGNAWAVLFIVFFALMLSGALLFLLGRSLALRKCGFYSAVVSLVLGVCCMVCALQQKNAYLSTSEAVVMQAVCAVKSSPGGDAVNLFVLHEGTKVEVLDRVGDWNSIQLPDGRKGWILSKEIEII